MTNQLRKERQANFELLRILAMFMVVALHYMLKGGIAIPMSKNGSAMNLLAWLLEAFCIVAVNVYVLISGYFLVEANWSLKKLVKLVLQILFYALLVPIVCLVMGVGDVSSWSIYQWVSVILPLQMEHYWFATAYVLLYIGMPLFAAGVKALSQKQLETLICLYLVFYSFWKSLSPILLATDHYGYDFGWFLCLFLVAAYIRLYGISWLNTKNKALICYVLSVIGVFAISALAGFVCRKTGKLEYFMDMPYCYNHILTLLGAIGLFVTFTYIKLPAGKLSSLVCKIAPYTFGVYLLHENIAIKLIWPTWFGVEQVAGSLWFVPHMLITVVVVFAVGILVDVVRSWLFQLVKL